MFQKATKTQSRLRLALSGASGSGKTFSALAIASQLGQSIAVIDSERGSASKYADRFSFDVCELKEFHPSRYVEAIKVADSEGYDVIIIDSLSHAWFAELDMAGGNFSNWAKIKPLERALVDAMLSSSAHVIGTMRSKTEWIMTTTTNKSGKETLMPTKVGTAPMQAAGIEYEFDLAGELNSDHLLKISKSRCPELSNTTHLNPGRELAEMLLIWLTDGGEMPESGNSKRDRVKAARNAIGLDVESVKVLLQNHFEASDPTQLSSKQVDELIGMFAAMTAND